MKLGINDTQTSFCCSQKHQSVMPNPTPTLQVPHPEKKRHTSEIFLTRLYKFKLSEIIIKISI